MRMSVSKPDHDYNYKADFKILRENQEFELQNILMSQPPLELTVIVTSTNNENISHLYSTTVGKKRQTPSHSHNWWSYQNEMEKST